MPRKTAKIGEKRLRYEYPEVTISEKTRTSTHEPIGKRPVIQYLGPASVGVDIRGHCYLDTIQYLRSLNREQKFNIRTEEFQGKVVLEDLSIEPEKAKGGVPPSKSKPKNEWRYIFDLSATQVQGKIDNG